jgi:RND family efflux transporter MFP subunit
MEVKAGQLLAKLDSSNVEASHRLAQAQLESAHRSLDETRSNIELAEKELKRFTQLVESQAGNQSDLDRAQAQTKSLSSRLRKQQAEIAVAEAEVAQWKQQIDDTIIVAPFGGMVTTKNSQPGEMISPMSVGGFTRTGICTIVDMASLEIEVDVGESYINRVKAGAPVVAMLDSYQEMKIPAKVIAIIPTADRQKATVKVRIGFDTTDPAILSKILPDMSVKVSFKQEESAPAASGKIVSIPKSAINDDGGRSIVWLVKEGKAERRAVNVSQTSGDQSIVAAGLSNGEEVVTKSSAPLSEGTRIKLSER